MAKRVHPVWAVCMTLQLLLAGIPWTVGHHRCMGRTLETVWFHGLEGCGMGMDADAWDDLGCCEDEWRSFGGDDETVMTDQVQGPTGVAAVLLPPPTQMSERFIMAPVERAESPGRPPPLPRYPERVRYQCFLI